MFARLKVRPFIVRAASSALVTAIGILLLAGLVLAQATLSGTVTRNANLRAGPGTSYAVVGTAPAKAKVLIQAQQNGWYRLDNGKWIASSLVTLDQAKAQAPKAAATVGPKLMPTATPKPQPTATPMPTAAPVLSKLDWSLYANQVMPSLFDLTDALNTLSTLSSTADPLDANWRLRLRIQLEILRKSYRDVKNIEPPSSIADFHARFVATLKYCNDAADAIDNGLTTFNADEITRGTDLVITCGVELGKMADELQGIQNKLR